MQTNRSEAHRLSMMPLRDLDEGLTIAAMMKTLAVAPITEAQQYRMTKVKSSAVHAFRSAVEFTLIKRLLFSVLRISVASTLKKKKKTIFLM